ncbi:VCBS repeat-containing protein [Mucilaginibacter sp. SP1R1]|uniref:VCBS repeat-containing protein n=1 Tax=Mucilaginibacter sp. SP1R1 TaxID=2723091 RepID=UPI0016089B72|nr:VCBS repeat-containing protein [Mucilaginibacter sp. SP1R1]MBB6151107.1 hypothetical protein [Mucilaginibacter sp. SP1R1]
MALLVMMMSCNSSDQKRFTDISTESGINFINNITEMPQQNIMNYEYEYNGAGVAVGDVNGDGLPDIYFTGNQTGNKLYLNKGNLKFEDITDKAGVPGKASWATGVTMADVNGDGLLDIYVCYSGNGDIASRANLLYINRGVKDGIPSFKEEAAEFGIDAPGTNSTQAVFFDYDRDGDLDMFLLDHATMFYSPFFNTTKLRTKRHPYFSNRLYRNDNGHFVDVSEQAGIKGGGNNFGLGVSISDINNDGWPDIYTAVDYEEQDFMYLNNHDGTFRDVTKKALKHISKNGMGCDIADYNNDGLMDIMVMDMLPEDNKRQKLLRGPDEYNKYNLLVDSGYFHQNMRNTLQLNNGINTATGEPSFSEIGQLAGVSNTDWSWSPLFADFDNDGYKDLFITNGFLRDFTSLDFLTFTVAEYKKKYGPMVPVDQLIKELPSTKVSNYIFKNNGDLTFKNVTKDWGLYEPTVANGAVYADLDNDGDLDLITNNLNEPARIYQNNSDKINPQHFLKIKLKAIGKNTQAIGAKVTITTANNKQQVAELMPVRGFQSSVEPLIHFGLGKDPFIKKLVIRWPDGRYSAMDNVKANQTLQVNEAETHTDPIYPEAKTTKPLFTDYTKQSGIDFLQKENNYVDFKHEFLLPWELSKQGPKLAKADVNGDGLEDVFIGAPMGQAARLYLQTADGRFKLSPSQPWEADKLCEDIQPAFFDADGDGDMDLYVVSGGNEIHSSPTEMQDRLYINDGKGNFSKATSALPHITTSKSCVAIADYNKDGKPDIFVGGRVVPGKYGTAPESYLLKNESVKSNVKFSGAAGTDAKALQTAGMITDAAWVDINKDGWPDLVVVGEWMPVKVFINNHGKLEERTNEYGLSNTGGLWTRIFPYDFDNDGNVDFLLGNLAPNTQFKASITEPMSLCVNDFLKTGSSVPVLCYFLQGKSYPYASRDEIIETMPVLKRKFLKYAVYADATIGDIFTKEQMKGALELKVHTLKNSILENKGNGKFTLKELPVRAQFSSLFGAVKGDFYGNGQEEILAAGNFYPFRVQLGREDAGEGILLNRNKTKGFTASNINNIVIDGDVRDMLSVKTRSGSTLIIVAKNNDHIQVIKSN